MGFVNKLQQADFFISNGKVTINSITKHKRYSIRINDLICFRIAFLKIRSLKRFKKNHWRHSKWNK
jgi:hypothetical protein